MKMCKRIIALALSLVLCLAALPVYAQDMVFYSLGSQVADFTVTTYDGKTVTLSEVLKEKDMVLLNIWASWCGPCEMEFPYMQAAYEEYKDRVEVIAVSCEENDTDDVLRAYAEQRGLTFPMARDTAGLALAFYATSIPVNVIIDRFGTVCMMESGAQSSKEAFVNMFEPFLGEDYTESKLFKSIPKGKPDIPASDEALMAEALDAPDSIIVGNPADEYDWPMVIAEEDGRSCLISTNTGKSETKSEMRLRFHAKAGDALAVTFKVSTEAASDLLKLSIDGETVKLFGGERGWTTFAHAVAAEGEHEAVLTYEKDSAGNAGDDAVYIDAVALLSGEEAAAALAANPAYPAAAATTLTLLNEGAKQIVFDDPTYALMSVFGLADYFIVPDGDAKLLATLAEDVDPEGAFLVNYYDSTINGLVARAAEDGYRFTTPLDSMETTGYTYTNLHLYPSAEGGVMDVRTVVCFASEENANAFVSMMPMYGYEVTGWHYVDGGEGETDALPGEGTDAEVFYTLTFIDQDGEPVPGVTANICDETSCLPMTSDAEGVIEFQNVPYAYDVHVIKVPEGYAFDTAQDFRTEVDGGEMVFVLTKTDAAE